MTELRVGQFSVGIGLLMGAVELIYVGQTMALALSLGQMVLLAVVALSLNAILALLVGQFCAILLSAIPSANAHYTTLETRGLTLCVWILSCWMILPIAFRAYTDGLLPQALVLSSFTFIFAGFTWTNAGYWLRKEYQEEGTRYSWKKLSVRLSLLLSAIGIFLGVNRTYGTANAIQSDPDILLITIDTLRRDHISAYHSDPSEAPVQTPEIDALANEGLLFWDAVTPIPETLPAHAAIMTGRHPAMAQVLSNGHPLAGNRYTTLAQFFESEGYGTAAFVSSYALDSKGGLDRGFQLYDDQFMPYLDGASELQLIRYGLRGLMRYGSPAWFPWLLERPAEQTIARATHWLNTYSERPAFLWVHLFEPHAPYEPHGLSGFNENGLPGHPVIDHRHILENEDSVDYTETLQSQLRRLYQEEVAYIDQQVGELVRKVRNRPVDRDTLVVITADHGEMLGEHSIMFHHLSLFEPAIQVPLIVIPIKGDKKQGVVEQPVRLMDLYNTIIGQAGFPFVNNTHSMDVIKFIGDDTFKGYGVFLLGRDRAGIELGNLFGYRSKTENTGKSFKYIHEPDRQKHWLFSLSEDKNETLNIAELQPEIFQQLKQITAQNRSDVPALAPKVNGAEIEALRSLGYVE